MPTKLDKTIKRELEIEGKPYTISISPDGIKIAPKGARKGQEMSWTSLVNGELVPRSAPPVPPGISSPESPSF